MGQPDASQRLRELESERKAAEQHAEKVNMVTDAVNSHPALGRRYTVVGRALRTGELRPGATLPIATPPLTSWLATIIATALNAAEDSDTVWCLAPIDGGKAAK